MKFVNFLRQLKKRFLQTRPLVEVLIYKNHLLNNLNQFRREFDLQIAPVLKSNAYGHGLVEVAQILDPQKLPFFVVDSLFEAKVLRRAGVKTALLVVGFTFTENILSCRLKDVSFTVSDTNQLTELASKIKSGKTFHLKLDTGMHRQGIMPDDAKKAIGIIQNNPKIILTGLCSHLADADGAKDEFTLRQIKIWNDLAELFKKNLPQIKHFHLAATAGIRYAKKINANTARLGLGLYGYTPAPEEMLKLKPVLEMKSFITSLREIEPGEFVGYNIAFQAKDKLKIATVPTGYFEGVDRRLSGKGSFLVGGRICPILGRVSMNISSIDVTNISDVKTGDEAIIISKNPKDPNSAENIAKICKTDIREIFVHIPVHLRRTVI